MKIKKNTINIKRLINNEFMLLDIDKYKNHSSLHIHKIHNYIYDTITYECNFCKKQYKIYAYIKKHIKTCSKKFICIICNKNFPFKSNLLYHIQSHMNL